MFSIYINKEKFIDFFIEESDIDASDTIQHSDWYKILLKQDEIGLDDYQVDEEFNVDTPLGIIKKNNPHICFADKSAFMNEVKNDHSKVLANPCGAFILNVSEEEAQEIRNGYGVICESTKNVHKTFLTTPDHPISKARNGKTWGRFKFNNKVPSNALIIQDRYFCKSDYGETIDDSFENFEQIIRYLLPMTFSGVYHLAVIIDGNKIEKRDQVSFQDVAKQFNFIKEQLQEERGYTILLEVLSVPEHSYQYDKTHNRVIISNYFSISALHKIKAFRGTKNLATQRIVSRFLYGNDFIPDGEIFEEEDETSDSEALSRDEWFDVFTKIVKASSFSGQYSKYNKNRKFPPIEYECFVNGIKESPPAIKNRILVPPVH